MSVSDYISFKHPESIISFDVLILIYIDCGISSTPGLKQTDKNAEVKPRVLSSSDMSRDIGSISGTFLHTNWQVQGYLSEQAYAIEK